MGKLADELRELADNLIHDCLLAIDYQGKIYDIAAKIDILEEQLQSSKGE